MRTLLFLLMLVAVPVAAQELPDAGLPDGSVGSGGADRGSEEYDPNAASCLDSKSCTRGFECVDARCVPVPVKQAGCSAAPAGLWLLAALAIGARRRAARS